MGVTVIVGLVVMMGGITSQGVVLLSLAETNRGRGMAPAEAVYHAAPMRVKPILMTQLPLDPGGYPDRGAVFFMLTISK